MKQKGISVEARTAPATLNNKTNLTELTCDYFPPDDQVDNNESSFKYHDWHLPQM